MTKRAYLIAFVVDLDDIAPDRFPKKGKPWFGVDDIGEDDIIAAAVDATMDADPHALTKALFGDTDMSVAVTGLEVVAVQALDDESEPVGRMVGWDAHMGPVEIIEPTTILPHPPHPPHPRLVASNGEAA